MTATLTPSDRASPPQPGDALVLSPALLGPLLVPDRARWPDLLEAAHRRTTRVVLAAAHLDHNPGNSRRRNLRSLCQRCHLLHDRPQHRRQRWITCRRRYALGDLFLGGYADLSRASAGAGG